MKALNKNEALVLVLLSFILVAFVSYFVTNFTWNTSNNIPTKILPVSSGNEIQQGGSPVSACPPVCCPPTNCCAPAPCCPTSSCYTGVRAARTIC